MEELEIWQAIILGLVQGLAEFLPISSSGHLILMREIMGVEGEFLFFDVMMHVGTLLAVFIFFFKDLIALFKPPFKTIGLIIVASIPAIIVGFTCNDLIEGIFSSGKYLCFFFLATAILMMVTEWLAKRQQDKTQPLNIKTAVAMGLMQGVGVFPGISRSGSTIFGGVVAKTDREQVAKFSFFMSIPVILGSAFLELLDVNFAGTDWVVVFVGMATSFISGMLAIRLMMKVIAKANYKWFALYLAVLSVLTFIFLFLGV